MPSPTAKVALCPRCDLGVDPARCIHCEQCKLFFCQICSKIHKCVEPKAGQATLVVEYEANLGSVSRLVSHVRQLGWVKRVEAQG